MTSWWSLVAVLADAVCAALLVYILWETLLGRMLSGLAGLW